MLAFMPPSPALSDLYAPPAQSSSTMSLAILPSSPMTYGQSSSPSSRMLSSQTSNSSKRPKLSLNTTNAAPTFGKKSTSLRLETLSATSPTAVNTFSNGYEAAMTGKVSVIKPKRPSLSIAIKVAPAISESVTPITSDPSESIDRSESTTSSAVSQSSASSVDSLSNEPPYKLAYNIDSILKNGPYPRTRAKQRTAFAQPRAMFPSQKSVSFKACLTEEIHNYRYTLRNSDIAGPSSARSTLELSSREEGEAMKAGVAATSTKQTAAETRQQQLLLQVGPKTSLPQTGDKRESSDEDDSDACPQTPVAGRRKRSRQWRWTLGPVGSSHDMNVDVEAEDEVDDE